MRRVSLLATCLAIAACSKAPDDAGGVPDIGGKASAGVAFTYAYGFALPGARISALQEAHAAACERLGVARCRITGLRYTVGRSGAVDASLSVRLSAPIARGFGRAAMASAEDAGATLTGVEIGGTEMTGTIAEGDKAGSEAIADRESLERDLARPDLSREARAELVGQRATLLAQARTAAAHAEAARADLASTPMTFTYATGRGTGFMDRVRDAGDAALVSISVTLTAILWFLAIFGPPLLVLTILMLVWRRWGRGITARLTGGTSAK